MGTSVNTIFASISFADCLLKPLGCITALRDTLTLAVYCILSRFSVPCAFGAKVATKKRVLGGHALCGCYCIQNSAFIEAS